MSICSIAAASWVAPEAGRSGSNGSGLLTSRSNGSMPSSVNCSAWLGSRSRVPPRRPACTFGCRVFTRPSRHSGKPVNSSTRVTSTRRPRSETAAVDPVETISTPDGPRPGAKLGQAGLVVDGDERALDRTPVVLSRAHAVPSVTASSWSLSGSSLVSGPSHPAAVDPPAARGQPVGCLHQQPPLDDLDPLVQALHGVVIGHRHHGLVEDGPGVDAGVYEEDASRRSPSPRRRGRPADRACPGRTAAAPGGC